LRFIVCGSVDHGKSTLIGRLLYESGLLFADQIDTLDEESQRHGSGERDFALLLDGLAAEREQKITIDVAYRFFTTARRKFIVADAPGHEQYTRNMATGASTADLAVLLVSAEEGLTRQARRHALILSIFGVRRIVVAVNKMDAVAWSESSFSSLAAEIREFASRLAVDELAVIPLSARDGDNLAFRSQRMRWYAGPSLLEYLETVEIRSHRAHSGFRMPVQWVNRPDSRFRGYCGLIASGDACPGMPARILPSGQLTAIERIVTADGDLSSAAAGQAVTLIFCDQIDASRGDVVTALDASTMTTDRVFVRLVWIATQELVAGRPYFLKVAAATVKATVERALHRLDLENNCPIEAHQLAANDLGTAIVKLDRVIAVDQYADSRDTGSFIMIDPDTCDTVGLGIVESGAPCAERSFRRASRTPFDLFRAAESHARSVAKAISWRATGSLDTFVIAAVVTGSSKLAGGVALAEVLTKTALYYVHERIWALIKWGRS
jgi:sulfate adenylyltransferase large subunit